MRLFYNKRVAKAFALVILFSTVSNLFLPSVAYALTSGPTQPEFSSFEPVATTNMVNEFTGDFTYNLPVLEVPGPHGSGYSMSLSYHSGVTPEEESSWVGYGWTLNAGAITRNTRGFPDDYNGREVKYHNKTPDNWTITAGTALGFEILSIDAGFAPSGTIGIRYNNYKGFGYNAGVGLELGHGKINLGYNVSDSEGSFSLSINPRANNRKFKEWAAENANNSQQAQTQTKEVKSTLKRLSEKAKKITSKIPAKYTGHNLVGSNYGIFSCAEMVRPSQVTPYNGSSTNLSLGVLLSPPLQLGISVNLFGSFSIQRNVQEKSLKAFGYMYSDAGKDDDEMLDYYVEKETPYNKRDVFLGVPFNNADNYVVSGEGLGGGFRMYNKNIGQFRPNRATSRTVIANAGGEVELGGNYGAGVDFGAGYTQLSVADWKEFPLFQNSSTPSANDEQKYFRFNNDLGGTINHPSGDVPIRAKLKNIVPGPGVKVFDPEINHIKWDFSNEARTGRSSYIAYHTNNEIYTSQQRGYSTYTVNPDVDALIDYNNTQKRVKDLIKDGIGEIVTYNEEGARYIYGLPVYSMHERNLQYGAKGAPSGSIKNNYISYHKNEYIKVGEERMDPYANSFLLTEIATADYVDRTLNGPSTDDLGGYTKFNYERHKGGIINGSSEDWYKWRLPYSGYMYHKNSLSDPKDDMVSFSEGQKEIYYLQSIETKTHVAIFETSARNDGLEAAADATSETSKGTEGLKKLNAIKLYVLSDVSKQYGKWFAKTGAKPIKTVQLRYNEELCTGAPNATSGKLTLKHLWFEYEGIVEAKISPYVFGYTYPATTSTKYPSKYSSLTAGWSVLGQNFAYNRFSLDAWGNYQEPVNGLDRYNKMQTWVDQTPPSSFDPAAYQLKVIKLPSGGEIHVQYEQDDYSYVQDQNAHVMASISSKAKVGNMDRYYLNTRDLGIVAGGGLTELQYLNLMMKLIEDKYVRKDKMFFKFLYKLLEEGSGPSLGSCNSEYITGYVDIRVGVDNTVTSNPRLYIDLNADEQNKLPDKVCKDFVKAERLGNIRLGDCDGPANGFIEDADPIQLAQQLLTMAQTIAAPSTLCTQISNELSYFRVPTPISKKGGGIRVKRLLMFDAGDGTGSDAVLYGNEYDYNFYDQSTGTVRSSGVATNEPAAIREENVLVSFIARKHQTLLHKIIAGKDKKQSEGPLGESILPGPSVGYSRVAVKNIHGGTTNPGFSIKEFYTAKDYPIDLRLEKVATDLKTELDYLPVPTGMVNIFVNNLWAVQGFSFVLNNMHGQIRRTASYGGDYNDIYLLNKAVISSEQQYEYFAPGTPVKLMDRLGGTLTDGYPGKEVDLTFAQSKVEDHAFDTKVEGDGDIGFFGWFPIPFVTAMPALTHTKSALYTHAISKVIRYPAIVKKVTSVQDGVKHVTENLAFDKYTGTPVSVRSWDDHTGSYLAQDIPASWEYPNMGSKALNEGKVVNDATLKQRGGNYYVSFGTSNCDIQSTFVKGDLVAMNNAFFHVLFVDMGNNRLRVEPSYLNPTPANILFPRPLTILRSGRTNSLNDKAGQITFHSTARDISTLSPISETNRYDGTDAFANALNTQLAGQIGSGSTTLIGPYILNISSYASCIPSTCQLDLHNSSVKNVVFLYDITSAGMDLNMMSFVVTCGGVDIKIDCVSN